MKLAHLLAQYLYQHKRLDLPGIGIFKLDPSVSIDPDNTKAQAALADGIQFESKPGLHESPELISFISLKTGKMKSLAISDLESHIEIAQQFLNMGKPFLFEGIGSLIKVRQGEYEFTPGSIMPEKMRDLPEKEGVTKKESVDDRYQAFLAEPARKSAWRKPVMALLVVCGIGLAIWGGYTISSSREEEATSAETTPVQETTVPYTDTTAVKQVSAPEPVVTASVNYKYILEVSKANKAFSRFHQLKETKLAQFVQLETRDSIQYKLFMMLPVTSDTTRVIDSLTAFLGKKVYIEHQN